LKRQIINNWDKLPVILDLHTVALIYDVTESTVKRWLYTGALKGFKIGSKWHFDKAYIQELSTTNHLKEVQ